MKDIGIFFFINEKLVTYKEDKTSIKPSSLSFIDPIMSHDRLFKVIKKKYNLDINEEYFNFERERIIFDIKSNKYICYTSKKIIEDNNKREKIIKSFSLNDKKSRV